MKLLFSRWHLIALAVALGGLLFHEPPVLILGLLGYVSIVAVLSIQRSAVWRHPANMSPETRGILRRLQSLQTEFKSIASSQNSNAEARVVAEQVLAEFDALFQQARDLDSVTTQYVATVTAKKNAEKEIGLLKDHIKATGEDSSLDLAIEARKRELEHHEHVISSVDSVRDRMNKAITELGSLRDKLVATEPEVGDDGLTGLVDRLQVLSKSYDEAEQIKEIQPK
ncbi:MAG TPA: hypothetical protein VNI20_07755 [Fimbriimonadaceae bacterium]|nr:hypothetical protein [Fimbriimonadaceae bacterium]